MATIVAEREQRTLKRLFLTPLGGFSYFIGIFLAHSVIGIGQALLVYAITIGCNGQFSGSLLLGGAVILLSIMGYVGVGFILGTNLARRTEDVNSLVATFGVPLLILGGAFVPVRIFPESLRTLAQFNPVYHMIEALALVLLEPLRWLEISAHIWFLLAFSTISIVLGWLSYWNMMLVERRL